MPDKKMFKKLDFNKIKTYPIKERKSKVSINDFVDLKDWQPGDQIEKLFPKILRANDLKKIADEVVSSVKNNKPVIWGLGAHVIKCGLSPLIIDLMKRKLITALAMNGAGAIHDFEIAFNVDTFIRTLMSKFMGFKVFIIVGTSLFFERKYSKF